MKRLKFYLKQMETAPTPYRDIYIGKMVARHLPTAWDGHEIPGETEYSSVYWHNDNALEITMTNKLAQDKPTVTWSNTNTYLFSAHDLNSLI